ncbi:transferrin-binding protein-like solute binding protein [Xenorhabdus sp. 12]|uniref:Transferrin-binding protein-like solute binding protein n=1 Tax=Xenorhabdus santafensis TaxID=2582833 RepID=A0ABU4S564_9GAMM|nr:Slam-dependent surface lipoprotein [Xenorhabdus sp. 12]MDX7986353.1 transferrin-binding protein-like solute binding protein [Xenorhabdus sp. 12]
MKKINIFIVILGTLGLITQAQAKFGYGINQQESTPHLLIGEADGEPGLGLSSLGDDIYPASTLKSFATRDNNDIYRYDNGDGNIIDIDQIPGTDIYFGEWSQNKPNKSDPTHTVFYEGENVTTNMPSNGSATYSVIGLNQYDHTNLLSGEFNANFDTRKMDGSLKNQSLSINIDANINDDAGFSGTATANGNINGVTDGKFFGDSADNLAGYTKFDSDRSKDTAFGGTKK